MSGHTPSTQQIRERYTWTRDRDAQTEAIQGAAFDRWLESVRAEERDRIARNIEADADNARWLTTSGRLGMVRAARIAREGA